MSATAALLGLHETLQILQPVLDDDQVAGAGTAPVASVLTIRKRLPSLDTSKPV
jgi:hypothetical protein